MILSILLSYLNFRIRCFNVVIYLICTPSFNFLLCVSVTLYIYNTYGYAIIYDED